MAPPKTVSFHTMVITTLLGILVTGAAGYMTFGRTAEIERVRLDERVRANSLDLGKLTESVEKLAVDHAAFLQQLTRLTSKLEALIESSKNGGP